MTEILLVSVTTLALSAALTALVRLLAPRLGRIARPQGDRWHTRPVAMMGGYAIAAATVIAVTLVGVAGPVLPLLIGAVLMFGVGALDDEFHFRATTKLVAQTVIGAIIVYLAPAVDLTGRPVVDELIALTWIVGITNAFNLLDNMDGLSAGIAVIAGTFYVYILLGAGSWTLTVALAAFTGAVLGFLLFNFQPASIFMGDSGSLFIGSFLGGAALFAAPEVKSQLVPVAAIPLLILLIPIFDTAFVTITRRLAGRSPMVGGRDHLSHRLVALGMHERLAVTGLYGLAIAGGLLGVSLLHVDFGWAALMVSCYLLVLAAIGIVLGHVEAHAPAHAAGGQPLVSEVAYRNRTYEVVLDLALITLAYYAAFRVRFEGPEFTHFLRFFVASFPIVLGSQIAGLALAGKYRQQWRSFGAQELLSLARGIAIGVASSVLLMLYLYRFEGFSRLVFALDAAFLTFFLVGSRAAITSIDDYLRKQRAGGDRVLIYGAGRGGTLLLRELLQNRDRGLLPIGFLDDDRAKQRLKIEGLPVLGTLADLAAVIATHHPAELIVSIRDIDRGRLGTVAALCREHGLRVRMMRFALDEIGPVPHVRHGSQAS